jgi:hypothetical protein
MRLIQNSIDIIGLSNSVDILAASVSGWYGITGPAGPTGPQGNTGATGSTGATGATGSFSGTPFSRYINLTFDGAGSALTSGLQAEVQLPMIGTISSWDIFSTLTGSCVIDVLKCDSFSTYPTFTSIAGSEKPTLSSTQKNQDTNLTSFTTGLTAGNILRFNLDSATTVQKVYLTIKIDSEI